MKIKKIIAANLQEGKAQVLRELGEDAIILSSRTLRKPGDEPDVIEIVAAVDEKITAVKRSLEMPDFRPPRRAIQEEYPDDEVRETQSESAGRGDFLKATGQIYEEIGSLKQILLEITDNVKYKYSTSMGEIGNKVFKQLRRAEFAEEYALKIVGKMNEKCAGKHFSEQLEYVKNLITGGLTVAAPIAKQKKQQVCTFVGPTGSGKTTNLVKLAVVCKLAMECDVFIVSGDIHKIGGSEQLQLFSSIAGIPFRAAYSPEELKTILLQEEKRDIIFIDTTGTSYQDAEMMSSVGSFISAVKSDYTMLTVSAATSPASLVRYTREFSRIGANSIVLTKLDEAERIGSIVEPLSASGLPLMYFSAGQRIPEDFEPASRSKISDMIFSETVEI